MKKIFKIALFVFGVILTILFALNHPQSLIFPMWIFVYLFKAKLSKIFAGKSWMFIVVGVMFGLIIEVFAILTAINQGQSEATRNVTLFHHDVGADLVLGLFYYTVLISTWYLILRKINFSPKSVLITAGIFGVAVEQGGAVLLIIASGGLLAGLFVFMVYGVYPMLAYYLTRNNFLSDREKPKWWHYVLTLILLYLSTNIITGLIFMTLKPLFG
jgi:hypothetical protein